MSSRLEQKVRRVDARALAFNVPPTFHDLRGLLRTYWVSAEDVRDAFDEDSIVLLYERFTSEFLNDVLCASDPETALREKLADTAYTLGCYVSLMLASEPEPDPTGLRNPELGVTGTLRMCALDLIKAYARIPGHELVNARPSSLEGAADYLLLEYLHWLAKFNILSKLRLVLDKISNPRPWEYVALAAACSMWEQTHREALGMPYALDANRTESLYRKHYGLFQLLRTGTPDPLAAWQATEQTSAAA